MQSHWLAVTDHRLGGGQSQALGKKVCRFHNLNRGSVAFLHIANFSSLGKRALLYRMPAFHPMKSINGLRQIPDNGKGAAGKQFLQRKKCEFAQILRLIYHRMTITGIIPRAENLCFQVDQRWQILLRHGFFPQHGQRLPPQLHRQFLRKIQLCLF